MVTHRQRIVRGAVSSEHVVQLFDASDSLGTAVAAYLHEGLLNGSGLLVVAKPANVQAIADALVPRGISMPVCLNNGQLTVLDAHTTLGGFLREDSPDAALFETTVGKVVRGLCHTFQGNLRIYGEMVEILAEEGNFRAAEELEGLWNELGTVESFTLLCGYSSAHFVGPEGGHALQRICGKHTRVHQNNADLLGRWLLNPRQEMV
jgi:hypothetical protein